MERNQQQLLQMAEQLQHSVQSLGQQSIPQLDGERYLSAMKQVMQNT